MCRLLGLFVAAVFVVIPSCKSASQTTRPEPNGQASEQTDDSVQQKLSEGGRKFNSHLALQVYVYETENYVPRLIGHTPAVVPLTIPQCRWWGVVPLPGVSVSSLVKEAKAQSIPWLSLPPECSDADLALVDGWPELRELGVGGPNVTDEGVAHLLKFKGLEGLDLGGSKIRGAGLIRLKGLKNLQRLYLGYTTIDDDGLANVAELKGLRWLSLRGTGITNAGLVHLAGLKKLRRIELSDTRITDEGLVCLKEMPDLRWLSIKNTRISSLDKLVGLAKLQELDLDCSKITDVGLARIEEMGSSLFRVGSVAHGR